jgi:hypothetical protein
MKLSVFALSAAAPLAAAAGNKYINYTTVKGYFEQDIETTDPSTYDYVGFSSPFSFTLIL